MKNLIFSIIIFALSILTACTKYLDLPQNDSEQKDVINGILIADSNARVVITKTNPIEVNDDIKYVDSAKVYIYENNNLLEQMPDSANGTYISNIFIQKNKTYSLRILLGENAYEANDIAVPEEADENLVFLGIDSADNADTDVYSNKYRFKLTINDAAGEDFYGFAAFAELPQAIYDSSGNISNFDLIKYPFSFTSEDNIYTITVNFAPYFYNLISLNDAFFEGQTTETYFTTDVIAYDISAGIPVPDSFPMIIQYLKFDKNAYDFFSSLDRYYHVQGKPFIEPVNVYTNIEGGAIGVIGAMTEKRDTVNIPVFKYNSSGK